MSEGNMRVTLIGFFLITSTNFWSFIGYRRASFYSRVTFLKKSCKLNTKFPFKTVSFLGLTDWQTHPI
jgi:hypothetical protein